MFFRQFYEEGLAQASYMIGCQRSGDTLVIDPRRDIEEYVKVAAENKLRITGVTETHIHADFLSGARELASSTGATLYLSEEGSDDWKYSGFDEQLASQVKYIGQGSTILVGAVKVHVLATPGHTPEHVSFLVEDPARSDDPLMILTGDFVFVGDLGRPDLLEKVVGQKGTAEEGAKKLFQSLQNQFLTLPGYVQVWPGHGAGSACGKSLGAVPSTTVGYERRNAWWRPFVEENDEQGFVSALLADQPESPYYFKVMKERNRDGMQFLGKRTKPSLLNQQSLDELISEGAQLVDVREKETFASGYIPESINIPNGHRTSTMAGWVLDYENPIVLVASVDDVDQVMRKLSRIGLDQVVGVFPSTSVESRSHLENLGQVDSEKAYDLWQTGAATLLDVRGQDEVAQGHIPGSIHIHAGHVTRHLDELPKNRSIVVYCATGNRSSTAASVLRANGFKHVANLVGGFESWSQKGLSVAKPPAIGNRQTKPHVRAA